MVSAAALRQRHADLRVADFDFTGTADVNDSSPIVIPPSLQEP
jgi:hypothetical protein